MAEVDIKKIMEALDAAMEIAPVGTSELIGQKVNKRQKLSVELLRIEAQVSIDRAEQFYLLSARRIQEAFAMADRDGKRGRILQFLQLAVLFFSTAKSVHEALAEDPVVEAVGEDKSSEHGASEGAENTELPKSSDSEAVTRGGQSPQTEEIVEEVSSTKELALGEWSESDSVAAKHYRIEKLLRAAKKMELDGFDPKSTDPILAEQYLEEAMAIFSTLEPTEADVFFKENRLTVGKELASAALPMDIKNKDGKVRIKFKPVNTLVSFLKSALKPQATGDTTIYGETARRQLFRRITSETRRVLDWRAKGLNFELSPLDSVLKDIEDTMECIDRACIGPLH